MVMRRIVTVGSLAAIGIAAHTAFNLRELRRPAAVTSDLDEPVSVIIPARNEIAHIEATVRSVLAQERVVNLQVIVLDDGSTDGTAEVLASIDDPRLLVITMPDVELPQGWLGKPYACYRASTMAIGEILVFVDADVLLEPDAVASTAEHLLREGMSLVSPYPRQLAGSWLEHLVQPLVTWAWASTMPVGWARRTQRPSLSAANGQFIVMSASAYRRIDGHAAVKDEVIEDVALMRAVKRDGGLTETMDGSQIAQCRMYEGTEAVVNGYSKSLWAAFNGPAGSVAVNALLVGAFVVPAVGMILARDRTTRRIGALGYAAGVLSRTLVAQRTGESLAAAAAQPASIAAFTALNVISWRRHLQGTASWKGRSV